MPAYNDSINVAAYLAAAPAFIIIITIIIIIIIIIIRARIPDLDGGGSLSGGVWCTACAYLLLWRIIVSIELLTVCFPSNNNNASIFILRRLHPEDNERVITALWTEAHYI